MDYYLQASLTYCLAYDNCLILSWLPSRKLGVRKEGLAGKPRSDDVWPSWGGLLGTPTKWNRRKPGLCLKRTRRRMLHCQRASRCKKVTKKHTAFVILADARRRKPGDTVTPLGRFVSTVPLSFCLWTPSSAPFWSRSLVRLCGINEFFQFLHLCVGITPVPAVPGYLSCSKCREIATRAHYSEELWQV